MRQAFRRRPPLPYAAARGKTNLVCPHHLCNSPPPPASCTGATIIFTPRFFSNKNIGTTLLMAKSPARTSRPARTTRAAAQPKR